MDSAESLRILQQAEQAAASGQPCALATVVGVQGSAYRHEGARLLVFADGTTAGAISGGCLESDVVQAAREAMRSGRPRLLRYDLTSDDDELWGLGLGCNGVVEVFIQPLLPPPVGRRADRAEETAPATPTAPRRPLEAPAAGAGWVCGR